MIMARRNYSAELREAQQGGQAIVCSVAPYAGTPVAYRPRRTRDPLPWRLIPVGAPGSLSAELRYSGRECHAVTPLTDAEQFFYDNGSWAYDPATETSEQGRVRFAKLSATAEEKSKGLGWWVEWTDDPEPLSGDCYDGTQYGFIATLYRHCKCECTDHVVEIGSVCSVDAPDGHPYRRVIESELAYNNL